MIRVAIVTIFAGVGGTGYWAISDTRDDLAMSSPVAETPETARARLWSDGWGKVPSTHVQSEQPSQVAVTIINNAPAPLFAPDLTRGDIMPYPNRRIRVIIDGAGRRIDISAPEEAGYPSPEWISQMGAARATRGTRPMTNPAIGPRLRAMVARSEQAAASRPTADTFANMP